MKDLKKLRNIRLLSEMIKTIFVILVITFVLVIGLYTQKEYGIDFTESCNNNYGVDNWVMVEKGCGIAQCWECQRKEQNKQNQVIKNE